MTGPNNYFKKSCISLLGKRRDCRKLSDFKITLSNNHSLGRHSSNELTKCLLWNSIHSFIHSTTCTPNSYKKQPLSSKNNPDKKFSQLHANHVPVLSLPWTVSIFRLRMHALTYILMYIIYSLPHSLSQLTGYPFNIFLFFPNIFLTNLSTWNYVILSILCHNSIMGQ